MITKYDQQQIILNKANKHLNKAQGYINLAKAFLYFGLIKLAEWFAKKAMKEQSIVEDNYLDEIKKIGWR